MGASIRTVGRWLLAGLMAGVLGGLTGCSGGDGGPTTYPVKGKVVSPGGQPWTGGRIAFQSVNEPEIRASGEIKPDGSFRLETHYLVEGKPRSRPGAVAGEHTVMVETLGGPVDRDGVSTSPPVIVSRKYQVEAKENDFVIEARRPAKP